MTWTRRVPAVCLAGLGWICAIWLATYIWEEWRVHVATTRFPGPGLSQPGPSRLLLVVGVAGLLAWGLAYWLDQVPSSYVTALTQWLAAAGLCLIGLVSVQPVGLFAVAGNNVSAWLSMYRESMAITDSWPLILLGVVVCLPRIVLAAWLSSHPAAPDRPLATANA